MKKSKKKSVQRIVALALVAAAAVQIASLALAKPNGKQ
jgi:hypothetical protein